MNNFSKFLIYSLTSALFLILLVSCGDDSATSKGGAGNSSMKLMDEVTSITELPSVLQESLSSEEKADLLKKILPMSDSSISPDEQFQNYVKMQAQVMQKHKMVWAHYFIQDMRFQGTHPEKFLILI